MAQAVAVSLCYMFALKAVASDGDVIAVETPTYHGLLELIDSLGMLAIEVETCPEEGVVIAELERTLQTHDVKACMFSTTLSNPLGVTIVITSYSIHYTKLYDKLKLAVHCRDSERYEQTLLREYMAYRLLNLATPMSFQVRLLRITWVDTEA